MAVVLFILGTLGLTGVTAMSVLYGVFLTGMPLVQLVGTWEEMRGRGITKPTK